MALMQGRLVAATSDDLGTAGDAQMVTRAERERSCSQVSASGGRVVAGCGASGARRVSIGTGDEGRGCG